MSGKLRFGMIGGGEGAFIGGIHLKGALFDGLAAKKAGLPYEKNYPDVQAGIESLRFVEACLASSADNGRWVKPEGAE